MARCAPEFLSLLEQYAKYPGALEGLEGACVAIVEREVKAALAESAKQSFSQGIIDRGAEEANLDNPHFDGKAYEPEKDQERLTGGLYRVFDFMMDRGFVTIEQISKGAKVPENSASAHYRALRKKRWGKHKVLRLRRTDSGLFAYCLVPNKESLTYQNWLKETKYPPVEHA